MRVQLITSEGQGRADQVEVADGTTVSAIFTAHLPGTDWSDYLVRVNRMPAATEQVLRDGDRMTITPLRIEGACAS
jgi:hypothetical protein